MLRTFSRPPALFRLGKVDAASDDLLDAFMAANDSSIHAEEAARLQLRLGEANHVLLLEFLGIGKFVGLQEIGEFLSTVRGLPD